MAEQAGEKTEAPTPRRRQEAREQGNIARSPDLTAALLLLAMMILLKWYGPGLVGALRTIILELLSPDSFGDLTTARLYETVVRTVMIVAIALAPLLVGLMLVAILANVAQVGLFVSAKRLQPKLGAINPLKGVTRLIGGGRGIGHFFMSLAKLTLVSLVAYTAIRDRLEVIVTVQQLTFIQIFGLGAQIIFSIAIRLGLLLLVLAILDYAWQRWRHEQKLKMSKQEIKEEMKRMEGDPHVKARRREIARQMAVNGLKKTVPTADVIVTNPTEFAIALKYDAGTMHAPRVVAKGQGFMAQKIREFAIAAGVPIIERKPLARALYKLVDVGQEIPEQFYSAVAEILAYVYELSGKLKRHPAGRG